jgi:hypothetical protein
MKKETNGILVVWLIVAILLGLLAYDIWACTDCKKRETISKIVTKASSRYLMIPLIFGILVGHFFWSQHND